MIDKALPSLLRGLMTFVAVGLGAPAIAAEPQGVTGSSLDRNIQTRVPLPDGHLDHVATRAALAEVHRLDPDAVVTAIVLPDGRPFADSDGLLADDAGRPALLAAIRSALPTPQPHDLLVIAKSRGEAWPTIREGSIGSGKPTGLGFRIDTYERTTRVATGESGRGFIAPYAYAQVGLVDLRTGAVVRTEESAETTNRANVGPDSNLDARNALPADEKGCLLNESLAEAVRTSVAHVVAPG